MMMPLDLRLLRIISAEQMVQIKRTGISRKHYKDPIVPQREYCIFAYDEITAKRVDHFGEEDEWWVEFYVDQKFVWVGDLGLEDRPELYKQNFMTYSEYALKLPRFEEPEMIVTVDIPVNSIINFYERGTLAEQETPERQQIVSPGITLMRVGVIARADTPIDRMQRNIERLRQKIQETFS